MPSDIFPLCTGPSYPYPYCVSCIRPWQFVFPCALLNPTPFLSEEYHSHQVSNGRQLIRSNHRTHPWPGDLGSTDNQDIMLLFVWHQTPPTPSPHYHQCNRRKLFWIFRCPVGQGYKNTNLAILHFESPLNCVFTPVIILGGSQPVPVGFVEQWRWCARRRCLNTDRKRTLQWFICYARACGTSAVLLVFRQLCTVLLTP